MTGRERIHRKRDDDSEIYSTLEKRLASTKPIFRLAIGYPLIATSAMEGTRKREKESN